MKLYTAPGTCSLAPHIVAEEAGVPLEIERVLLGTTPRRTAGGADYARINPNGYVPALQLDDGSVLTEGMAISLWLADLAPARGLVPAGGLARARQLQWLAFIATELHKSWSPWLFHPEYGEPVAAVARQRIAARLGFVEARLQTAGPLLFGNDFTAADAYLFTVVGWADATRVDLRPFPALRSFMERVAARPAVQRAVRAQAAESAG